MGRLRAFENFSISPSPMAPPSSKNRAGHRWPLPPSTSSTPKLKGMSPPLSPDAWARQDPPRMDLGRQLRPGLGQCRFRAPASRPISNPSGPHPVKPFHSKTFSSPPDGRSRRGQTHQPLGSLGNLERVHPNSAGQPPFPDPPRRQRWHAAGSAGWTRPGAYNIGQTKCRQPDATTTTAGQCPAPAPPAPAQPSRLLVRHGRAKNKHGPLEVSNLAPKVTPAESSTATSPCLETRACPNGLAAGMVPELKDLFGNVPPPNSPNGSFFCFLCSGRIRPIHESHE